jgi:putative sterol carrier protein
MAVKFLTDEWAKALTEACNADAKFSKASKGANALFQINVEGSPQAESFTMRWTDGQLEATTGAASGEPDVVLNVNYDTMVELSKGTLNGPLAVATGRMKAEGNMEKMFSLGKAMDQLPTVEAGIGLEY